MLILAPVACFPFVLLGALFFFRSTGLKRAVADPAIYVAQTSPQVAVTIGLPMQPGWPIRGTVLTNKTGGNADLIIPLNGGHGRGTLVEWAQKNAGRWQVCSLLFRADTGASVMLVNPANTHCAAE